MVPVKRMFEKLPTAVPGVTISEAFRGHNASRQDISCLEYHSVLVEKTEKIKVEIGIREPLNDPIDLAEGRKQELNRQLEGQLRPVLRPSDFVAFKLNEAFGLVDNILESLPI